MEKLGERIPRCWVSNFRGCDQSRMEARQISSLLPSSSFLRYGIFMTISRLIETFLDSNFFSFFFSFFFFHLLLSRSLPGAFVLHRNAYCLVVSTRRYFHPSRSSNLRVLKNQWIVLAATVAIQTIQFIPRILPLSSSRL